MKTFLKKFFSENLSLKLFSVLLACLLEFYFHNPGNSVTENIYAYARIEEMPSGILLTKPYYGDKGIRVRLKVKGPLPLVQQVKTSEQVFNIELPPSISTDIVRGQTEKKFVTSFDPKTLSLPSGVKVEKIEPSTLELYFEEAIKKALDVEMRFSGDLLPGLKIGSVKVSPKKVFAYGPKKELENVNEIYTNVIKLDEISSNQELEIRLDGVGEKSKLESESVKVKVRLEKVK